jgi:hypothetical protein
MRQVALANAFLLAMPLVQQQIQETLTSNGMRQVAPANAFLLAIPFAQQLMQDGLGTLLNASVNVL